jgi:hypothetical protein
MTAAARYRLLSGVRVSLLVLEEIRSAQKEGRLVDPPRMLLAAEWGAEKLREIVVAEHERRVRCARFR